MQAFNTLDELATAYMNAFNSRCTHKDEYFTVENVKSVCVREILKPSLQVKHGIAINAQYTHIINSFGYVKA